MEWLDFFYLVASWACHPHRLISRSENDYVTAALPDLSRKRFFIFLSGVSPVQHATIEKMKLMPSAAVDSAAVDIGGETTVPPGTYDFLP